MTEDIGKQIKNRINKGLTISRVPKNTRERFLEIASMDEFCRDYGNCLAYLIRFHDGIVLHGNETIMSEIENLKNELNIIKKEVFKEEKKPARKMINGTQVRG